MGKYDAQARYIAEKTTQLRVTLCHSTDKDILEHLGQKSNKSGYVKGLIRADIAREQAKD